MVNLHEGREGGSISNAKAGGLDLAVCTVTRNSDSSEQYEIHIKDPNTNKASWGAVSLGGVLYLDTHTSYSGADAKSCGEG